MNNKSLETIVPPLELCKQIPVGEFAESVLVWTPHGVRSVEEIARLPFCKGMPVRKMSYPAPTLAEIIAELPEGVQIRMRTAKTGKRIYQVYHYSYVCWTTKPASNALRLWLSGKGIEVKG